MDNLLLETKLLVPRVRRELVARPRLVEMVERATHAALTLVSAPAGFGKTTLLTAVVTSRAAREDAQSSVVAWVSLDERDADATRFWRYVLRALEEASPGCAAPALSLISSRVLNARLQSAQELSGLLNRALAALPRLRADGVSEPLSCLTAREAFRAATDPVSVWIDQKTMTVPGGYIPKAQLLEQYNADAINDGRPTITANAFGRSLRRNRPQLVGGQRRLGGRVADVWLNLTVRSHLSGLSGQSGDASAGANRAEW